MLDNLIDHNAQEGFSAHGNGGLYQGKVISYNNFDLAVNINGEAGGLDFRRYAAASSQARRMAWISSGVGWSRLSHNS